MLERAQRGEVGSPAAGTKRGDAFGAGFHEALRGLADEVELHGLFVVAHVRAVELMCERQARVREPFGMKVQAHLLPRVFDRSYHALEHRQAESEREQRIDEERGLELVRGQRLELKR